MDGELDEMVVTVVPQWYSHLYQINLDFASMFESPPQELYYPGDIWYTI